MRGSGEVKDLVHFSKYSQNKLVVAHLNIKFLGTKFELLTEKTKGNIDILLISEQKLTKSFPDSQLKIDGLCFWMKDFCAIVNWNASKRDVELTFKSIFYHL